MDEKYTIYMKLNEAIALTRNGKFREVAELLADVLGLIKHAEPRGTTPIPGIHVNTRAGYMIIGGRGLVPDDSAQDKAAWMSRHKPLIDQMIFEGKSWADIGAEIGCTAAEAEENYRAGKPVTVDVTGRTTAPGTAAIEPETFDPPNIASGRECAECGAGVDKAGVCVNCGTYFEALAE